MTINAFSLIILAALVLGFALDLVANLLNLGALKMETPAALQGVYDPEQYRKSQEYSRAVTRFGLVSRAVGLAVLLAFWSAGGFNYLDRLVRDQELAPVAAGLVFIGILLLGRYIIDLPFSIYGTFVIEQRFGFNRTTVPTFILDRVKALALGVALGALLLAAILALFEYAGAYAWLYCWASITVFTLVMQYVAPMWIMPLFNKFTPLGQGDLRNSIMDYAASVDFPLENVYVMDGSKRSSRSNAFFTGFGRKKRIALFDTLIEKHSVPEMVAILAHEVGHYKKKHIIQGMIISIAHTGVILFLLSVFLDSPGLYQAFSMEQQSVYAGLVFFGLLYTPMELLISLGMQMISRKHEYEADRFAAETIEKPEGMVDALKKLSAHNLSNLTPHPFYVFLHYSHPPLLQRVEAVRKRAVRRAGEAEN